MSKFIDLDALEAHIEQKVEKAVERALGARQEPDPWLTATEAADYLGLAVSTLHDLVCDGELPRHGPRGHRLRFRRSELDAYAARGD